MGEIRSTLDIIMEKTNNMTLSSREREEQVRQELAAKVDGLIQNFLNKAANIQQAARELQALQECYGEQAAAFFMGRAGDRVSLDEETRELFRLLDVFVDTQDVRRVYEESCRELKCAQEVTEAELMKRLYEEQGISGSAVKPVFHRDPDWSLRKGDIEERFLNCFREKYDALLKNMQKRSAVHQQ